MSDALCGAVIDYKPMKDGGGWLKIEFDELQWARFREAFPASTQYMVAIARLDEKAPGVGA